MKPGYWLLLAAAAFTAGYLLAGSNTPAPPALSRTPPELNRPAPAPGPGDRTTRLPDRPATFQDLRQQPSVFATLHLAHDMAASAEPKTLPQLTRTALDIDDPLYQYNVAAVFVERMIAIDVRFALDTVTALPPGKARNYLLSSIMGSWARLDEDAAFRYFARMDDGELKQQVAAAYFADTTLSDSFRFAVEGDMGPMGERLARQMALQQAAPADAFDAALNAGNDGQPGELMAAALRWFKEDPDAALLRILQMENDGQRRLALQAVFSEASEMDPQQALTLLDDIGLDDDETTGLVLMSIAARDPERARSHVESYVQRTGDNAPMMMMLRAWFQRDPEAARTYTEALPPAQQNSALWTVLEAYAESDPRGALEWAAESGEMGQMAISSIALDSGAMREAAESLFDDTSDPRMRSALLGSLAARRAREGDPGDAIDWLQQYSNEDGYDKAYAAVLQEWAASNPQGAAAEVLRHYEATGSTTGFVETAWAWSSRDTDAAIDWAVNLPDSAGRTAALAGLVQTTAHADPDRALTLYREMPPGRERDQAALVIAAQDARGDEEKMRVIMRDLGVPEDTIENYMSLYWR